jgi:hypothetical protein
MKIAMIFKLIKNISKQNNKIDINNKFHKTIFV